jgi:tRNA-2-methylthio-N6-dimethylallyladenosine synthase
VSAQTTSDLPAHREQAWHGWVSIMTGCDNFCTYCVVPYVRGREASRELEAVLNEVEALVASGVREITLLGQNVNSYGRDLYGAPRFADALAQVAATGIERIGFATSHPKDLCDETIEVMATTPAILRYLHLPFQSGSNRILKAMNRGYTRESYRALVDKLYAAMPDLALSTDIIVGFPGETESDFAATLDLVKTCGFDAAFTFLYSPREGTPAATMPDQVPHDTAQKRFERLVECVQTSALENNISLVGSRQEVLVEGASKRDGAVLSGRTHGYKTVHSAVPDGMCAADFEGQILPVTITEAHTWYLLGEPCETHRTHPNSTPTDQPTSTDQPGEALDSVQSLTRSTDRPGETLDLSDASPAPTEGD